MALAMRVFYTSENGDEWLLVRDEEHGIAVVHRPNPPSGGHRHVFDLATFLALEPHSAQNQSLRSLIATLLPDPTSKDPAEATSDDKATIIERDRR